MKRNKPCGCGHNKASEDELDKLLLDEEFDEIQTEDNWQQFNIPAPRDY